MYTGDGLFVMFQTPSRTPFQSDNAMAVVGTRHNNLVTHRPPLPRRTPVLSISYIQPSRCSDGVVCMSSRNHKDSERENRDLSGANACMCVCLWERCEEVGKKAVCIMQACHLYWLARKTRGKCGNQSAKQYTNSLSLHRNSSSFWYLHNNKNQENYK